MSVTVEGGARAREIAAALEAAFAPRLLKVVDESAQHAGHAGAPEGGQSHFRVTMRAGSLPEGRLARHRAVHGALGDLMGRLHALALDLDA